MIRTADGRPYENRTPPTACGGHLPLTGEAFLWPLRVLFEDYHEDGEVGGVDAFDAGGVAEGGRADLGELLAGFEAEAVY